MAMTREELFRQVLEDMDVEVGDDSRDVFAKARQEGLTTARNFGDFQASRDVTREEAALVMGRALGEEA